MALDLVLTGGTVVDGTGAPALPRRRGHRGRRASRRSAPASPAPRRSTARGHVVAPGFIDTHSHSDLKVLADPALPMKVRQGITLEVFGQDGISVAPVRAEERGAWKQKLAGLLGDFGVEWDWSTRRRLPGARAGARGPRPTSPTSSRTARCAST